MSNQNAMVTDSERKLAAIMFTDIVGYTALTQRNESLALELLQEHRRILRPIFHKHFGLEIKTIGDGFLIEFASALEAVRCGFDIQQTLHQFNENLQPDRKIRLRIGIHVGDVIHSQNDVYGDAVNIASRIEALAEPEGACLTGSVREQIYNKFEFPLKRIYDVSLKNVEEPVDVYRIVFPWEMDTREETERIERRRIAILPLANISSDPKDEYFADGLTEELISTLSKIGRLSVVSRTSVIRFKSSTKNIQEISEELKVGTLLEGSVRKEGNRVRISVQLIDAVNDRHLWSETYDRELVDIFAIQSDIAKSIAQVLELKLLSEEKERVAQRPTRNMEAYTLYLQGRKQRNERTRSGIEKAMECFVRATQVDAGYALPYVGIADCYSVMGDYGFMKTSEAAKKMKEYATKALSIDDMSPEAHATLGCAYSQMWEWDNAEKEFKRSIELNSNYSTAHQWYAIHLMSMDRNEEAIRELKAALELDPLASIINTDLGIAYWRVRDFDKAADQLQKTLKLDPRFVVAYSWLGNVYIEMSRISDAIKQYENGIELDPGNRDLTMSIACAKALSGDNSQAKKLLEELTGQTAQKYTPEYCFGFLCAAIGDEDGAIRWFEKSSEERGNLTEDYLGSSLLKNLRSNPRFVALAEKIKKTRHFDESNSLKE